MSLECGGRLRPLRGVASARAGLAVESRAAASEDVRRGRLVVDQHGGGMACFKNVPSMLGDFADQYVEATRFIDVNGFALFVAEVPGDGTAAAEIVVAAPGGAFGEGAFALEDAVLVV